MRKRIWLTGVVLLVLISAAGSAFAAESAYTKEEIVQAYIERVVPESAEEVLSAVQVTVKDTGNGNIIDVDATRSAAEAYTYRYTENGEEIYHTVLVLQLNDVPVTEDDEITVDVNDCLSPFSPQDGVEYTRSSSDDLWSGAHEVTVMPKDLQTEVLLGSELKSGAKDRLICMSFPSSANAEKESEAPEYDVTVTSSPKTVTVPVWALVSAGVMLVFIVIFVRKKRAA